MSAPAYNAEPQLQLAELEHIAKAARSFVFAANKHVGGSTSSSDLLVGLYFSGVAKLSRQWREAPNRDRVVFSKGHACTALYFCLWLHGYFDDKSLDEMLHFGELGSDLPRMPQRDPKKGIEMSTGALGQGLSFGNGIALAARKQGLKCHTYVVLGDAECGEGQVWEAAASASSLGLKNLTAIVDANGFGSGIEVARDQWVPKWRAFGWSAVEIDGHNMEEVCSAYAQARRDGPCAIIMRTIKGYGLARGVAGTNQVGNEVDPKHWPSFDLNRDVASAKDIIQRTYGTGLATQGEPGRLAAITPESFLDQVPSSPVGSFTVTKTLATDFVNFVGDSENLFFLSPDAIRNSGLKPLLERFGSWTWDNPSSVILACPIAEQDTASIAGGLAASGLRPAVFLMEGFVWRMLDAVRESIAFPRLKVVIVGTSGGLSDPLGPMVQSDSCFAALLSMPGLECFEASDINEGRFLFTEALKCSGPAYLRLPHEPMKVIRTIDAIRRLEDADGCWHVADVDRPDLVLVTAGSLLANVCEAASQLMADHGVTCRICVVYSVTRFRRLSKMVRDHHIPPNIPAVSVHNAPSSVLGTLLGDRSVALGVDSYGCYGAPVGQLYEACGLGVRSIVDSALALLRKGPIAGPSSRKLMADLPAARKGGTG